MHGSAVRDGYDLSSSADRGFAFDYDHSGNLDHVLLYRPGTGTISILAHAGSSFSAVYDGSAGDGIGGYDLASTADRAFAFDYGHGGMLDALVLYRPGTGTISVLANDSGTFSPVYQGAGTGIGGYDLMDAADRAFAFDYDGSGKLDHIVLYRPGTGAISILKNDGATFTAVHSGPAGSGIGGYDLASSADRAFAFDYAGSGNPDHLVLYRPGTGTISILRNDRGTFAPVYQGSTGIGGFDLADAADRAFAFDYDGTGSRDHLVLYRPGTGIIRILENAGGTFAPVYAGSPGAGIGGYDLTSTADRAFPFDYGGTGLAQQLALYRPGSGIFWFVKHDAGGAWTNAVPGAWTKLVNQPAFAPSTMLLLTDGSVMCHASEGHDWHRLTPDANGDYVNGTWSALASTTHAPLYYASAVLRDGRVFRAGGEYDAGTKDSVDLDVVEIYDPLTDVWSQIASPPNVTIGDAISCVLADGRVMIGNLKGAPTVYDPATGRWTPTGPKANGLTDEESWTLLPDSTVLTADCYGHPRVEKYLPGTNVWMTVGNTPVDLVFDLPKEIGPALLLPNGDAFLIGGTGNTVLYTPGSTPNAPGTLRAGPPLPSVGGFRLGAMDAPGVLLPNGKVLFAVSPVDDSGNYRAPTALFEYDAAHGTLAQIPGPPRVDFAPYLTRMLLLPSGEVLFAHPTGIAVYEPGGAPDPAWKPAVTECPAALQRGVPTTLRGRQLNGLSQACSYGDDAQMATNYPIVRLQYPNGRVVYCRTAGHSTMGVATGARVVSTSFTVPPAAPDGGANLLVVANGIASDPVPVAVGP